MFGKESPSSILDWNRETFDTTVEQLSNRTILEIAELYLAALNNDVEGVISELADVAIMVWAVAAANGIDINLKPAINQYGENIDDTEKMEKTRFFVGLLYVDYGMYVMDKHGDRNILKLKESIKFLNTVSYIWNIHLPNIVDDKMAINRSRTWKLVGKDNYQHI